MRDQNISIRVTPLFKAMLAELRRAEPDLPSQTAMIERLVTRAYDAQEKATAG